MIWLNTLLWSALLACGPSWSESQEILGDVLVLDAEHPEITLAWSASLDAQSDRVMDGTLELGFSAYWTGGGVLRAFWGGYELTPPPVEDTRIVELEPFERGCSDDGVIRCALQGAVTLQLLEGESVEITPSLLLYGDIQRPPAEQLMHVELLGQWGLEE